MKRDVAQLLEEAKRKLSGYSALYAYRLMNLCVEAEVASLLSVEVETEDGKLSLEDAATILQPDKFSFIIIPNEPDYLKSIAKGIVLQHPEFNQDFKTENIIDSNGIETELEYISVVMPEVDDDRYKTLKEGIDALTKPTKERLEITYDLYGTKLEAKLSSRSQEEKDQAKEELQKIYDLLVKTADDYHDKKLKEIEEAHDKYLADNKEKEEKRLQEEKAHNKSAGLKMKMMGQDDD